MDWYETFDKDGPIGGMLVQARKEAAKRNTTVDLGALDWPTLQAMQRKAAEEAAARANEPPDPELAKAVDEQVLAVIGAMG